MYMHVSVWRYVQMSVGVCGVQERVLDSLQHCLSTSLKL